MKKIIAFMIALMAVSLAAGAADYTIDDEAIDALIESSVEVSPLSVDFLMNAEAPAAASFSSSKSPIASFLLCTFLGGFGVHRHYMGTRPFMWAIYTFTFGGIFGVVPLIDWIFLIVGLAEDDISQYCGNTSFFMWS